MVEEHKSAPTRAGGCFWTLAILLGAFGGLAGGNVMKGILIGTAAGGLIALAVWLVDRSRSNDR